jgi:hypothetical protein
MFHKFILTETTTIVVIDYGVGVITSIGRPMQPILFNPEKDIFSNANKDW